MVTSWYHSRCSTKTLHSTLKTPKSKISIFLSSYPFPSLGSKSSYLKRPIFSSALHSNKILPKKCLSFMKSCLCCMSLSHHHLLLNNAYLEGGSLDSCRSTISTSYEDLAIQNSFIIFWHFYGEIYFFCFFFSKDLTFLCWPFDKARILAILISERSFVASASSSVSVSGTGLPF